MRLSRLLDTHPTVLFEASVVERLRHEFRIEPDEQIANAAMLLDEKGRRALRQIYREYIDIGFERGLPVALLTPTWRATRERLARVGGPDVASLSQRAFALLAELRDERGEAGEHIAIGGLMGPRGDAYRPEEALPAESAQEYHAEQAQALAATGVDFLMAATLPSVEEALGIGRAMVATGVESIPSFVVRRDGCVLDGSTLPDAISRLEGELQPRPFGYMINCVHPANVHAALSSLVKSGEELRKRLLGLQANGSDLPHEALDGRGELASDEPEPFARVFAEAIDLAGLRLVGGCCGTDASHLRALGDKLIQTPHA